MDPVSASILAATSLGATAAGGGIKAFGDIYGSEASAGAYRYQAAVAQMNSAIANKNAQWAIQTGEVKAQESGMQTAAKIAQTKAAQGASGLAVNSGSGVDVRASEADIGKFNEMTIRSSAARQAYGFEVQSAQEKAQAGLDLAAAKNTITAGEIGAAGSLLGTAGSVSSKWLDFSKQGIPGFTGSSASSGSPSDFDQSGSLYG